MPLIPLREDSLFKAFIYASLVVSLSSAIVLEYRAVDPFGTYRRAGDGDPRPVSWSAIAQTSLVAFVATNIVLWFLYLVFGLGQSFVLAAEMEVTENSST